MPSRAAASSKMAEEESSEEEEESDEEEEEEDEEQAETSEDNEPPPEPLPKRRRCLANESGDASPGEATELDLRCSVDEASVKHLVPNLLQNLYTTLCDQLDPSAPNPEVVARESETEPIRRFVEQAVHRRPQAYMLYISGIPGTGKTTVVKSVLREFETDATLSKQFVTIHINGMTIKEPTETFSHVLKGLAPLFGTRVTVPHSGKAKKGGKAGGRAVKTLRFLLEAQEAWEAAKKGPEPLRKSAIVIFDEMDQGIGSAGTDVLFDLVDLMMKTSRVTLIGIANRQNLYEKFRFNEHTMRLGSRTERHKSMIFKSYNVDQLTTILQARMKSKLWSDAVEAGEKGQLIATVRGTDVVPLTVCQFVSKSAVKHEAGDCRYALSLMKQTVNARFQEYETILAAAADRTAEVRSLVQDGGHALEIPDVKKCPRHFPVQILTDAESLCLAIIAFESHRRYDKVTGPVRVEAVVQRYQVFAPQMTKSAWLKSPLDYQRFVPVDALLPDGQPPFPPAPPPFASSSALLELCHEASQILTTLTSMGFASAKGPNICLGRAIDHFVIAAMVARHTALKTVTSLNELTAKVAY